MRGQGVPLGEGEDMDPGGERAAWDLEAPGQLDRGRALRVAVPVPGILARAPFGLEVAEGAGVEAERLLLGREVEAEEARGEQDCRPRAELDEPGRGDEQAAAGQR